MKIKSYRFWLNFLGTLLGSLMFVVAINVVIVPHQLYSGTLTGVAQVIESLLVQFTPLTLPQNFNLTGSALLLLNVPLIVMVLKITDNQFLFKSIVNIVFLTLALSFVPVPTELLIYEPLTAAIAGGVLAGFGAGFTLRCGGSGGGADLIGIYCSYKFPNFTVGRVTLIISVFVYSYGFIAHDLNTVIYSAIFTTIYAMALDYMHYQNIKTSAMIFTTNPDAVQLVMKQLERGATCWEGKGAYSGKHTHIFTTVLSKYEVPRLKKIIKTADPGAFIIINHKIDLDGNFIKKL
jgi:uncharacterized membrane-anchored protein YitT (DUF2179 family)